MNKQEAVSEENLDQENLDQENLDQGPLAALWRPPGGLLPVELVDCCWSRRFSSSFSVFSSMFSLSSSSTR